LEVSKQIYEFRLTTAAAEISCSAKIMVVIHVYSEVRNTSFLESWHIWCGYCADARLV